MLPKKILDYNFTIPTDTVEYSLVVPVFNQENIIEEVVDRIFKKTIDSYELIIILDSCTDRTEQIILKKLCDLPDNLKRVKVFKYETPAFETTCDNFGFKAATGRYIIEIQADIYIYTYGFNKILTEPFRKYNDVLSVSGRCTHSLFNWGDGVGKLGSKIETPLPGHFSNYDSFYVGDTCNRGPWALCKEKLSKLNYLDEENFVLGDDDHDLNIRGNITYGWVCGYVPIEIRSALSEGSTRKTRDTLNTEILEHRKNNSNGGILRKVQNKEINFNTKPIQIRKL